MTIWDLNDTIDSTYLMAAIKMVEKHKYKIRQDADGRWSTYVKKKGEKRKLIRKATKKELETALIDYYDKEEKTFIEAYDEWRSFHDRTICNNSISKYDSDKKRYFTDRDFASMRLKKITEDDVRLYLIEVINDLKLCKAAIKKLYYYVKDVFDYSVRRGYALGSPLIFLTAREFYKYAYDPPNVDKPKVITIERHETLLAKLEADLAKMPDYIPLYAVEFASLTGMRAGEIVALRWDDVKSDYILVCRSQKYDPMTKEYYISKPKNGFERVFPITNEIRDLLSRVQAISESDYIFGTKDGPTNFRIICSCIKNKCRQLGIETYGIHAYRRTVNSQMALEGVPVSLRASLLGHSEEVNSKYYTYDVASIDDKVEAVSKVNTKMNTKAENTP